MNLHHYFEFQDVRIGSSDTHQLSVDLDESILTGILQQQQSSNSLLSGSPPQSGRASPPSSQSAQQLYQSSQQQQQQQFTSQQSQQSPNQLEALELQIDFWPIMKPNIDKDKIFTKAIDQGKNSLKSTFRNLQVSDPKQDK